MKLLTLHPPNLRSFTPQDELVSRISRKSIDLLKVGFVQVSRTLLV